MSPLTRQETTQLSAARRLLERALTRLSRLHEDSPYEGEQAAISVIMEDVRAAGRLVAQLEAEEQ